MSIAKVLERKSNQTVNREKARLKIENIVVSFRKYAVSQLPELENLFPFVCIGEHGTDICSVSYSKSSHTLSAGRSVMSPSTNNIAIDSLKSCFNIGYGANTASGSKQIPFSLDMTAAQQKRLFKQVLEYLVSMSYSVHSERDWKINEEIKAYYNSHSKILRKDLNSEFMCKHAVMFQRGGTHNYYKMDGKLFVDVYGREIYEFVKV